MAGSLTPNYIKTEAEKIKKYEDWNFNIGN